MIIVKLTDGLGNQMFQYAMARNLAERYRVPLKLDLAWFDQNQTRRYSLKYYQVIEDIATLEEITTVKSACIFREKSLGAFTFDEHSLKLPASVYLEGYWQSEQYFRGIKDLICREYILKRPLDTANAQMARQISTSQAIAVHIRRGDYVTDNENHQLYGVCPMDYYVQAARELANRMSHPHFFVFSDDWDWFWALEILKVNYPVTLVTLNSPEQCYQDLYLMSLCKAHIIANSSFSWWGAWLAPYQNKIVIAPSKWLADENVATGDVIPEAWVRI